jgi:hypothetical protein
MTNYYAQGAAIGSFLGAPVKHSRLDLHPIDVTRPEDRWRYYKPSPTLTLELCLDASHSPGLVNRVARLADDGGVFGHRDIGWGHVCGYCGSTYVTGVLICPQCGGATEVRDKAVERKQISGYLTNYYFSGYALGLSELALKIELDQEQFRAMPQDFGWQDMFQSLSQTTHPRARLCPWCGALCKWNSHICEHCGGQRLPITELQDLRRTCWYCGQTTEGNYVCDRCLAPLSASYVPKVA